MSAPERIWANEGLEWHSFDCSDVKAGWTHPYILATPAALAASPEAAKLIREAEARGMDRALVLEQTAEEVDRHYAAGDMGNPGHWVRAIAPADGLAAVEALRQERDEWKRLAERTSKEALEAEVKIPNLRAELAAAQQREAGLRVALERVAVPIAVPVRTWRNGINFKAMYEAWRKEATVRADIARAALSHNGRGE